jgi:putative inorganic carbon (HCO3(-)) transporter
MMIIYFIVTNFVVTKNRDQIRKLFQILIVSAVLVSILGIAKHILGFEQRVTSPTSGYVTLAVFLAAIFSFTLGMGLFHKLFQRALILWSALLLILLCLTFTFSRSQWLAAFFVMIVIGIVKNVKIPLLFFLIIILIILFSPAIQERAFTLLDPLSHSSGRLVIWKGAYDVFPERPILGFGIGTFHTIFPFKEQLLDKGAGRWHSDYLQIAMESGLLGLAAFFYLIMMVFKRGITLYRRSSSENGFQKGAIFGLMMAILSFLIGGLWSDFISDPISSMLFWFLIGMLAVFWEQSTQQETYATTH